MRVSQAEKERSRERILDGAARMIRERGVEGASVADIMNGAGLTHGGFYRHFKTKDDLVAAALDQAFGELLATLDCGETGAPTDAAVQAFVARYLSEGHVAHPGFGCPIPTLAGEIGRAPDPVRRRFADGVRRLVDTLGKGFRGSAAQRRARACRQVAMMAGAVMIARAGDAALADEVLAACRSPAA